MSIAKPGLQKSAIVAVAGGAGLRLASPQLKSSTIALRRIDVGCREAYSRYRSQHRDRACRDGLSCPKGGSGVCRSPRES